MSATDLRSPAGHTRPAPPAGPARPARHGVPNGVLLAVISLCTAVTAANIYLATPLLAPIARDLGVAPSAASWIASAAQLGYALGLLFLAPLGDTANRRRLVAVLSLVTGAALVLAGVSPVMAALGAAVLIAAATTVIPQLLVPLVAERAPQGRRALHVGAVVAGLSVGSVAARVLGGLVGQEYGWRWVFFGSAALTVAVGLLTAALLPADRDRGPVTNPVKGVGKVLRLIAHNTAVRAACLRQGGLIGAWSAVWTALVLLLTGDYRYSIATAGLFGLFGLVATVVAPMAGGLVDRLGAARVVALAYALAAASMVFFWLGGQQIWALCVAAVLIHMATFAGQVANQSTVLAATTTPSTANSAYVASAFLGGAIASALAGPAFGLWGWSGVCAVAAVWMAAGWLGSALLGRAKSGR